MIESKYFKISKEELNCEIWKLGRYKIGKNNFVMNKIKELESKNIKLSRKDKKLKKKRKQ
jgi:hypothetical protein